MSTPKKTTPAGPWEGLPRKEALKTLLTMDAEWYVDTDPILIVPDGARKEHALTFAQAEALAPGLVQAVQDFAERFMSHHNLGILRSYYWHWLNNTWKAPFKQPGYGEGTLHPAFLSIDSDVTVARSSADFFVHALTTKTIAGRSVWDDYTMVRLSSCTAALDEVCPGWNKRLAHTLDLGLPMDLLQDFVFGAMEPAPTVNLPGELSL